MTKISLSDLAIYRMRRDHASVTLIDPLMLVIGCLSGAAFSIFAGIEAGSIWALIALFGTFLASFTTTRIRISAAGVIVKQYQFVVRREEKWFARGRFEAHYATAFDDSEDRQAIQFGSDDVQTWRARNRMHTISWLNDQLERLGLLFTD